MSSIEARARAGRNSTSLYRRRVSEQVFPENGIPQLFTGKRPRDICFCLAFVDSSASGRQLRENIEDFESNVAKYALIELYDAIQRLGFDFKVIQLRQS